MYRRADCQGNNAPTIQIQTDTNVMFSEINPLLLRINRL